MPSPVLRRFVILDCWRKKSIYQGASPDCMPMSNGKKPLVKICKKDENLENGRVANGSHPSSFLEGKTVRLKGGSSTSNGNNHNHNKDTEYGNSVARPLHEKASEEGKSGHENQALKNRVSEGGGDMLLQWGQNKRSRGSRAEYRNVIEESSVQSRKIIRIERRGVRPEKQIVTAQPQLTVHSRSTTLRPCTPVREATAGLIHRNSEDPSASGNGPHLGNNGLSSEGRVFGQKVDRDSSASPEKPLKAAACPLQPSWGLADGMPLESTPSETEAFAHAEKVNMDLFEWPRIFISLSRKEKEDDFLAIKGTKLPQRPKKRAKNVDKTLQYCFPGNWLSDLTRGRYEVREKKCVKKKPRGLKAMESLDSDSE